MLFNENKKQEYSDWLEGFKDKNLYEHIRIMEELLDTDLMNNCLLIDDAIVLLELMKDECVRRVGMRAILSNY